MRCAGGLPLLLLYMYTKSFTNPLQFSEYNTHRRTRNKEHIQQGFKMKR